MIQVMAALRKLVGIIGSGFEMLQDFVDEIFHGILPASFVAKYATAGFQTAMEARYSQPTSAKNDRGQARKNVPTMANARPISRISSVRNSLSKVGKYLGAVASSPVGKASGVLALASLTYDIVNDVLDAEKDRVLAEMWPDNFTLFGYSDIVDKFDNLESFLLDDSSCYTMYQYERLNLTMQMFPCLESRLQRYATDNPLAGTTSIDATQCWADATPSLGQNSLFACSSASTCCASESECGDGRGERIPCGTCGEPSLALTNKFGCHNLLRKCVCGTIRTAVDRCAANMHCDAEAQCELVSSIGGVNFGVTPCKLCPSSSQVVCLLNSERGMPGSCSCVMNSAVQLDLCNDRSGMETGVDASRLCGYMHGQSSNTMDWSFDMENIMLVPCAQVRSGVCSTVYNSAQSVAGMGTSTIRMVVASSLRVSSVGGGGGRRRLLMDTEDGPPIHQDEYESEYRDQEDGLHDLLMEPSGWDKTAQPCRDLVQTYQENKLRLGVLEKLELRRCGFWRFVGRRVLERHNLTESALGRWHETFLLSMDDLVRAMMSEEGAGLVLFQNPGVLASALMYHPWMRPVRKLGVLVANRVEHMRWARDIEFDVHEALFGDLKEGPGSREEQNPTQWHGKVHSLQRRFPEEDDMPEQETNTTATASRTHGSGRKLMSSVVNTVKDVAAYSAQIIQGPADGGVPVRVAGAWSTSSFSWPPVYDYRAKMCPLAVSALEIGRQAVLVVALYFKNFGRKPPPIDRSLRANLPDFSEWIKSSSSMPLVQTKAKGNATNQTTSWASWTFHKVLEVSGVSPSHLVAFFTSDKKWGLQWILESALKCDLASVVTCSRHDKDLVMSSVVFILIYFFIVRPVTSGFGVGFLSVMYILSYPWFILWYAFGTAPSCFPMVPTCLLSDIIATLEMLVPSAVMFPTDLRCDDQPEGPLNQTCLRSCQELNFNGWEDPLGFAICDTDPQVCRYLHSSLPAETGFGLLDVSVWGPLQAALKRFDGVVTRGSVSGLAGHRLCTWVSFVTATPVLGLVGVGFVLASAACMAALDLIPSVIGFMGQLYVFYSANGG